MTREQMINDLILRGWEPGMRWRFPVVTRDATMVYTTGSLPSKLSAHSFRSVRWDAISTRDLEKIHGCVMELEAET